MKKCTLFAIVVALLYLVGCTEQEPEKENGVSFGAYFYLDSDDIIHSDDKCEYVAMHHGAKPIYPNEIKEIGTYSGWQCCSQCLNEEDYKFVQWKCQAHQNRIKISNILYKNGYHFFDSQDWINTVDNEKDLKWVYDRMKEWGYDFGSSFVEFKEFVGVDNTKKETVPHKAANGEKHHITYIFIIVGVIVILLAFVLFMVRKTRKTNKKTPLPVFKDDVFSKKKRLLEFSIKCFKKNPEDLKLYNAALNNLKDILMLLDEEIAARDCVNETVRKYIFAVCMMVVNEFFYSGDIIELSKRINEMSKCKDRKILRLNSNYIMHQCWIGYNESCRDYKTKLAIEKKNN